MLTKDRTRRILLQFAAEARSVSDVANALREPLGKVFYHVRNFQELGLVAVAREEARQGKPIKYYRTVAESFFLPSELIGRPFTSGLAEELRYALEHRFYRADLEGVALSADAAGGVQVELLPRTALQGRVAAAELWQVLHLSDQAARALARDLRALFGRYEQASGDGEEFLLHAAFAKR